ncbi:MAG: transglutaminaseTgpA domain-containing protein [Nocardioides sp.]
MSTGVRAPQVGQPQLRGIGADMLAVCAIGILALLPLWTTFAEYAWFVVGVTAVVVGAFLVGQWRARSWPVWALPFAGIAAYVVSAQAFVSRHEGLGRLIIDDRSWRALVRGSVDSWALVYETLPRVDATGKVLLVPLILGLVPAFVSAALACYTRSALLPVTPLLAGMAVALTLGRGDTELVWVGLAVAAIALLWSADRNARNDRATSRSRITFLARAFLALLALGGGSVLHGVALGGAEPTLLRETVAKGLDTSPVPTLLDGFRRYRPQDPAILDNVNKAELLRVSDGAQGMRLRFAALDWYDGNNWRPNPDTSPSESQDRYLKMGHKLDNPASGRLAMVQVEIGDGYRGNWVPLAGQLQELGFYTTFDRIYYNVATGTAVLRRWVKPGESYYFVSRMADATLKPSMKAAQDVDPDLYERAGFVDPLAQGFLKATGTPMEAFFAAAEKLKREGAYSDGAFGWETRFLPGHGAERLGTLFLDAPQVVGNDEQYAAALALLGIRMKIPTRVVVGAVVPDHRVVTGADVRAWVEVQLADGTWRTMPTERFLGTKEPKPTDPPKTRRGTLMPKKGEIKRQQEIRQERKEKEQKPEKITVDLTDEQTQWWPYALALLALLAGVPLAKLVRRRRRRTDRRTPYRFARGWQELIDTGRDLGHDIPKTHSRPRQAEALGQPRALAVLADEGTFGDREPTEEEATRFWEEIASLQRELRTKAPWWHTILGWLNPTSFWRR